MSALTYLTLTRLKNGIRDLLRKPARLIYVVFLLALLVFAVQGSGSTYPPESYRDLREVVAMATALFLFIFLAYVVCLCTFFVVQILQQFVPFLL